MELIEFEPKELLVSQAVVLQDDAIHDTNATTRNVNEVQDTSPDRFADKLKAVFQECLRVLKPDGLLVFTYHHSRDDGWQSLDRAIRESGFCVVNAHPVKAEMSVATPKNQAKDPIQFDMIIVCRKADSVRLKSASPAHAVERAIEKITRLEDNGFAMSRNDWKIVLFAQLLTTNGDAEFNSLADLVERTLAELLGRPKRRSQAKAQALLFE